MAKTDEDHISGQIRDRVAKHGRAAEFLLASIEHDPATREPEALQ